MVVELTVEQPLEPSDNYYPPSLEIAVRFFSALAKRSRLEILQALMEGPRCVQDLVDEFDAPQPSISKELQVLRKAKLVTRFKHGTKVYYSVRERKVFQLIELAGEVVGQCDEENVTPDNW